MKNKKISVITTSYSNRNLSKIINNILLQTYTEIEIIIVDDLNKFNEEINYYFIDNVFINIFKPDKKLGYYKSLKYGLMQATGDFIVFNTKDCIFNDKNFFNEALKKFSEDVDMVFGKTEISSKYKFQVNPYKFRDIYTPDEFLLEWEKLRMIFVDYIDLNSFIFKKKLLLKAKAFSSNYENALSLDTSTILKSVILSKKIAYVDSNACKKFINTLNNKDFDTKNIPELILNHFALAFDIQEFIKLKGINLSVINKFLNKYADYAINSIYFDYFMNFNNEIFNKILEKHDFCNKNVYIYGKGWIGLELEKFLNKRGIKVESFIDDYRTGEKIIDFNKFKNINHKNSIVIIATYKYKDALNILKKLKDIKNINIVDLFVKEIE